VILGGLIARLVDRRQFEVWETASDGQPCFMVAAELTRQEAVGVANRRALANPRQRMLVLDGRGNLIYRVHRPQGSRSLVRDKPRLD
jgi:3-phenylpropionate/cinnamic acid dioxygenase small subunit